MNNWVEKNFDKYDCVEDVKDNCDCSVNFNVYWELNIECCLDCLFGC